jgi:predicted nucleic acid-binding protein
MDVVFLDANVLYSAAHSTQTDLRRLCQLAGTRLVTSAYALEEASRNLSADIDRRRLTALVRSLQVIGALPQVPVPPGVDLPEKDLPILAGAIAAKATHLLTGDKKHFGRSYGRSVAGITILPPREYLTRRR